uniref:Phospholipase_D-nuclease N-terminal n=1 Tax=Candidatus Kentrum sp. MB TaxID=2138164 RepID=A0A450XL57_9GAMM|nr:MAG: hypothetical protein BECKMB1821G_GA0114241_101026 [Candidatus Kentron sp. MB]VFK30007.1 MAG: hypothetical protein BECKMB1821I_GA0114274_101310 [Candidatus Kentron sp. MB]VFK75015.1 MAG: hypothetical protein BECKMB1821H_GA0114242_101411 [Candidatus Kentron sp. MB]
MYNEIQFILTFLPWIIFTAPIAIVSYLLAKEKGRNIVKWTILGCVPFINVLCLWYFIGAANKNHEEKLDIILRSLQDKPTN